MPAALISGLFGQIQSLFNNRGGTIFNGVLIVLTFSGQAVFQHLTFKCPCSYPYNFTYGSIFLFTPALILFVLGILINKTTWRLVHGCFYRSPDTKHGVRQSCYSWLHVFSQSIIAPLAWQFILFLEGSYWSCFMAGRGCIRTAAACIKLQNTTRNLPQNLIIDEDGTCVDPFCICDLKEPWKSYLRAESQYIAITLVASAILVASVFLMISRSFDRFTYAQNYYINLYRDKEQTEFEEEASLRTQAMAEQNVKAFFDKDPRTKYDWDRISRVSLSQLPRSLRPERLKHVQEPLYSSLHQWVKEQNVNDLVESVPVGNGDTVAMSDLTTSTTE